MKKQFLSIMTATAMTLSAMPFSVSAETTEIPDSTSISIEDIEIVAQGECGENAEWTIDNNGTLVISGTGRTKYDYSNMLFSSYSDKIVNAVVGEGITSIDICFFMNCKNLKSVTLPESLESILGGAFDNCENLSEINIPENTTYIAGNVFKDTLWLENKRAENPLVIVNNMVIDGKNCKGNVVIPDGVTTILGGAFENATDISSVKIPETVTYILEYAFINCTSLKSVKLPNGITKIKVLCFAGCSSLESVEIPASVEIIENDVFFGCTALKEIEIPQNTIVYSNSIGYYGESECKKIEDIILKGYSNSPAQAYAEENGFKFVALDEVSDTTTSVITTETITTTASTLKGDANLDGSENMADAVLIMQSLANPDKYGVNGTDETHITAQGEKNGDMDGNGLTNADALEIQKMLLKIS